MPSFDSVLAPRRWQRLRLLAVAALAMTAVHCGSDSSSTYDELWNDVFNRCGACHGAGTSGTDGGPDMTTQDLFHTQTVNKTGNDYPDWRTFHTNRPDCAPIPFIDPGNPNNSLVLSVLDPSSAPCTVKDHTEPPESIAVTSATVAKIRTWIADGAAR